MFDGSNRTFGYNEADNVTSYTDENQSAHTLTVDVLGRKTAVAIARASGVVGTTAQIFQYDGLSRATFARDSVGSANADLGVTYDSINRTLEEQQIYGGVTSYISHVALRSRMLGGLMFAQGRQLTVSYDSLYRKNSVREASDSSLIAAWDFFGFRTAAVAFGNGIDCSFMNDAKSRSAVQSGQTSPGWGDITTDHLGYDGSGRLIGKRYMNGSAALVGFTSAYDKSSNMRFERPLHAESRSSLYDSYDSINRLRDYQRGTLAVGGGSISAFIGLPETNQQQAYNLDVLGNWLNTTVTPQGGTAAVQSRSHNPVNQITAYGILPSSTPIYYDHGNNVGTPPQKGNRNVVDDGVRSYAFDALNRLMTVSRKSDGLPVGQYVYDAVGRRIQKTVSNGGLAGTIPNGTIRFLYDGEQIVEEVVPATTTQYIWGRYVDELVQMKTYTSLGPQPLGAGSYYILSGLLYSAAALADSVGSVVEAYDVDSYGNTLLFSGPGLDSNWFSDDDSQSLYAACRYGFTGREYDPETRLYFFRARFYHPQLGRFLGRDMDEFLRPNLYEYALSAPVRYLDPYGMAPALPPPAPPPAIVQPAIPSPAIPAAPSAGAPGGGLLSTTGRVPANPGAAQPTAAAEAGASAETVGEIT